MKPSLRHALVFAGACAFAGHACAADDSLKSLTVCADPGNMPLSDQKGEGFQNKIAQVLGKELGVGVSYYWRPSIERGLMRTTLSDGNCDLWMDMATDTDGAVVTAPLYRSTFVLAYRSDKGYGKFQSLNEPRLQNLRIGVFQMSAARQALSQHGIMANTVVQYISHNGDLVKQNQPSYQIKQVVDGKLDIAAAWGPMAGYYKTIEKAPLVIQPMNTIDDTVPLEFSMTLATARGRPEIKAAVERAMRTRKNEIRQILVDYGVPLVHCADCVIDGDLPSHGEYKPLPQTTLADAEAEKAEHETRFAALKEALKQGADVDEELGNAIVANDPERVAYVLDHGANANVRFNDGYTPLTNATRFGFDKIAAYLLEHKADANQADISHWTPLMYAAWNDDPDQVRLLTTHGAKIDLADEEGSNPLAIAAQNGKARAAAALIEAGADVNLGAGTGGYTPLMLAANADSLSIIDQLLKRGARVNAKNAGGVTALMIAAAKDQPKIAARLLAAGADVTATSQDGRTATKIAQSSNSAAVLKLLQGNEKRTGS
ncbi:MAG: quinoprotein dehydrogenase-associated putative ABC transporter substrate-binding protein [Proteobacteria bacterium]|uniref:quinoprotein dehydrogenase-associated putative ABC transporter substrate-binding protein n=1 Tax=Rudaea sp. TaxID=2136325 RepID=UPI001D5654FE|nr:quinoprotein dehydrogenase-associated putative ABC transporter substrate-binding protein [Pseudomonadota bacterium]MBS0566627.1 quinoprotein dehydrogenase-associated putative ABC transporter substrate-binding protein [Pseudomonadota bacterium]